MNSNGRGAMAALLTLAAIAVTASAAGAESHAPEDAMRAFYAWVLAHPSRALPSPRERAQLANVLSPQLSQLLKDAAVTEARCVKAAPRGDKPLIVEGDLFVGNYEGASEVAYGALVRDGDAVRVDVDLVHVDARFPRGHKHRAVAWKDYLELRFDGTRWRVHDVRFRRSKSLAAGLQDYIDEGERACAEAVKP